MDNFESKTLGFVYHVPFWEENGQFWTTYSPLGRYVEALASNFKSIKIIAPLKKPEQEPLYRIRKTNLDVINIINPENVQTYYLHLFHYYFRLFKAIRTVDILNIRIPSLIGFPAFIAARIFRKPIFLVVVGGNLEFLKLSGYSGIKKFAAYIVGWFQDQLMEVMIKGSISFTNGADLYKKYRKLSHEIYLMRSSTINRADILPTFRDTCQKSPYHILTVAIVSPRKGTSLIPKVIAQLKAMGIDITWNYVGFIEGNSGQMELEKTIKLAEELDVCQYLTFESAKGYDELLPLYRESDIFVLPTYMEGVPRVILEAQASGLPVITTKVGGIPGAVKDGIDAILLEPGKPEDISSAIRKVIFEENFRQSLIRNGISTSTKHTVEEETARMIRNLKFANNQKIIRDLKKKRNDDQKL